MPTGQIITKTPSFNEVLILEKSGPLKLNKEDNSYVLEGICAIFGQRNNNNRVYEEKDYLPHLESLNEKINKKMLLGELDHPEAFEVSYKNVSHIIEALTYNPDNRSVSIKLRLLDTPMGKIAKTLVESGIPLAVSSRAAGQVTNEGKVSLHKIFTYDLVCEPGFSDAILKPTINESLNHNYNFIFESLANIKKNSITSKLKNVSEGLNFGEGIEIFEIPAENSDINNSINNKNDQKITSTNMAEVKENKYVSHNEMNGYSEVVRKEFETIKTQLAEATTQLNDVKSKLSTPVVENVQSNVSNEEVSKMIKYMDHLTENMNNIIKFNNYLATELNKSINHVNHVAEATNNNINYSNYISENLNNSIRYTELVGKKTNEAIKFANYLATSINEGTSYTEYVGKLLEKNINFGNYIATELNEAIEFGNYLSEQVNFGIKYTEHIAENLNNTPFNEAPKVPTRKLETLVEKVQESVQTAKVTEISSDYYVKLNEKIEKALSEINSNEPKSIIESKKYPFLALLSESNKEVFYNYDYKTKEQIVEALNKGVYFNEKDVMSIVENTVKTVETATPAFIKHIPAEYVKVWESLNESQRTVLYNQASVRDVRTPYQVKNFWDTRLDLKGLVNKFKEESATTKVTESIKVNTTSQGKEEKTNESFATKHYSKDYLEKIQGMINKRTN